MKRAIAITATAGLLGLAVGAGTTYAVEQRAVSTAQAQAAAANRDAQTARLETATARAETRLARADSDVAWSLARLANTTCREYATAAKLSGNLCPLKS